MKPLVSFIKKYAAPLLIAGGAGVYVLVAGTTGSCPACATLTGAVGLPSLVASAHAADAAPATPETTATPTALKVGDRLPDTQLRDLDGSPVSLRGLVEESPAVLIFYRGGWCPYCTKHLSALAEAEKDILAAGHRIIAISPDQPATLAETPGRDQLHYRLLSDSDLETARAFGITFKVPDDLVAKYKNDYQIDLEAASGRTHHLLPHPAVYIVNTGGIIRFAHVNEDYKVRLAPEKILEALRAR